jgi:hypothetical protein
LADLPRILSDMTRRIAELERRQRGQGMEGRVSDADPVKGLYRVELANGFKTGWIPARSASSGALKMQAEPTIGQMVMVRSESGDLTDAAIEGSGFTDDRPHDKNGEWFASLGAASLLMTEDRIILTVGGSVATITAGGIAFSGSTVTHDGKDIGKTHTHGGVARDNSNTNPPN